MKQMRLKCNEWTQILNLNRNIEKMTKAHKKKTQFLKLKITCNTTSSLLNDRTKTEIKPK